MEATVKLNEDEVVKLCARHCECVFGVPDGKRWVGSFELYSGVTCTLENLPLMLDFPPFPVPAIPVPAIPASPASNEDDEVPF